MTGCRNGEREKRKEKKKKKEFDVRSAHPARGTRDAIVERKGKAIERFTVEFDFEIEPRSSLWKDWIFNQCFSIKKKKSCEICRIDRYRSIILGKISEIKMENFEVKRFES